MHEKPFRDNEFAVMSRAPFVISKIKKTINLFATSKNETMNSPIHQFTNLKALNEKARLKMFF